MKHEAPALRMIVEDCKLVPAAAWEQERLSTYRNRSIVNVHITQEKNRKLERKYWAILGEVIKSCPTKQRTKEDLHRAIRLKLGVVDAFFTFSGQLRVEVKSTSTMEDPEYQQFYEDAMALLHEETGVDPEQLSANSPDVGEDEQETSVAPHAADEGSDGPQPSPDAQTVAADQSGPEDGGPAPADETEAREEPVASSAGDPYELPLLEKKRACIEKFLNAATDPTLPDAKDRQATVIFAKDAWKAELPDDLAFVKACTDTANKVVKGELQAPAARKYLEGLL